jgi:hypothetical protein
MIVALALPAALASSCDVVVPEEGAPRAFLKSIGGPLDDEGFAMRQTADGGFVIAGRTASFGAGRGDVYLVKTDPSGNLEWAGTYGGSDEDEARDVLQLADGGYLVVGSTLSFGSGSSDVYVIRTDAHGDTIWTRTVGTSGSDQGNAVVAAIGGGFIIGGRSNSSGTFDHYLARLSPDGDTLWTRAIAGSNNEQTNALARLSDGYLLAGSIDKAYHLVRVDTVGRRLADRQDITYEAQLNAIVPIDDQSSYVVGYQKKGGDVERVLMMKVNTSSRSSIPSPSESAHTYGRAGGNIGYAAALATDGNLVLVGSSKGFGRLSDLYVLEAESSSGTMLWSQGYGGAFDDQGRAVVVARDGGIVMLGTSASFVDNNSGRDILLMKVDAGGALKE